MTSFRILYPELFGTRCDRVTPNARFWKLWEVIRHQHQHPNSADYRASTLVGIDPGETTGIAIRDPKTSLTSIAGTPTVAVTIEQLDSHDIETAAEALCQRLEQLQSHGAHVRIVMEDYRVYQWKASDHVWSPLHTAQFIGAIRRVAYTLGIPVHLQMAIVAKQFVTDLKLKDWDLYSPGLHHGRDAERHLLHYLLFGTQS